MLLNIIFWFISKNVHWFLFKKEYPAYFFNITPDYFKMSFNNIPENRLHRNIFCQFSNVCKTMDHSGYYNSENYNATPLFRYKNVSYSDCLHSSSPMQTQEREENLVRVYEQISIAKTKKLSSPHLTLTRINV